MQESERRVEVDLELKAQVMEAESYLRLTACLSRKWTFFFSFSLCAW